MGTISICWRIDDSQKSEVLREFVKYLFDVLTSHSSNGIFIEVLKNFIALDQVRMFNRKSGKEAISNEAGAVPPL